MGSDRSDDSDFLRRRRHAIAGMIFGLVAVAGGAAYAIWRANKLVGELMQNRETATDLYENPSGLDKAEPRRQKE